MKQVLMSVYRLTESSLEWLAALAFLALGLALAQGAPPIVGPVSIPTEYWVLASVVIGWIVKEISSPLTSLLKKWFGFEGNVTRLVYFALALTGTVGYGLATGAFGQGKAGWLSAGAALITALVKGFGDYQKLIDTSKAGIQSAEPVVVTPVGGLEDLHE